MIWVTVGDVTITMDQFSVLSLMREGFGDDFLKWHMQECGCCIGVHTTFGGFVIGPDGNYDYYPDMDGLTVDSLVVFTGAMLEGLVKEMLHDFPDA